MDLKMWKILLIITIVISSTYAADLHCSSFTAAGSCVLGNITNATAPNEKVTVIGQPSTYTDPLTTSIALGDLSQTSMFDFFPTDIFNIFPKLQKLSVSSAVLNYMVTDAFNHCPELTEITTGFLGFLTLPSGFAQNCVKLANIEFSSGRLRYLDPDALKGLTNLKNFAITSCKASCIPPSFFSHTPNIETISMRGNRITALDPTTFKGLTKLSLLDFSMNTLISYLPNIDFTNTATLATTLTITFDINLIQAIDPKFVPTLYDSRKGMTTFINLSPTALDIGSCVADTFSQIDSVNYKESSLPLGTCYNNWSPSLVVPVPCAPKTTTSTTSTSTQAPTTTTASNGPNGNQGNNQPCCEQSALKVILQSFRNMTFDAKFN